MRQTNTRIVTRGDDSGSCRSANRAILDAYDQGVLRNTSVMVPGPAFEEAAEMYRNLDGLCVGLHATVTDEWHTCRWGPVLGAEKVPTLVMDDGTFFKNTKELWDNGPDNDEILAELRAQLALARARGLTPQYLDEHMAFQWFEGLEPRLAEFAEEEGLTYIARKMDRLPQAEGSFADPVERLLAGLDQVEPGRTYLMVTHPCYDDEEVRPMAYGSHGPGEIARQRDWDRRLFMDPRVTERFAAADLVPTRFSELADDS